MNEKTIRDIQVALEEEKVDAWFFCSFRGSDPISHKILGVSEATMATRRWFYVIPRSGEPLRLCHRIEPHTLDGLPGRLELYSRWEEWQSSIRGYLKGATTLAVQFSEGGVIPSLGRLDAGTADFLRKLGFSLASSGDLVARFEVGCSKPQIEGHYRAMEVLLSSVEMAFAKVAQTLSSGLVITEYELQQTMLDFIRKQGLVTDNPPIVAVGAHAADPHYTPQIADSFPIPANDILLLDIWGKEDHSDSVFADITWCAFTGPTIPPEVQRVWEVVRDARDAGIQRAREVSHRPVAGWEVDRVTRDYIAGAGFGDFFIHRTGHSIHTEDHANGANMDDFETRDFRHLLPNTLFSIEPGVYLPGRFGIRSEVNMLVTNSGAMVTGKKQEVLPALLSPPAAP